MSTLKVPFGLRVSDQRMVGPSPDEVENGAKCGCVCAGCNAKLIARQGEIMEWHFAHESNSDCAGALESSVHLMAKQLVMERSEIFLPALTETRRITGVQDPFTRDFSWAQNLSEDVQAEGLFAITDCREECAVGQRRPDVLATFDGKPIAIEIAFTHFCDDEKIQYLSDRDITTIEVDVGTNLPAGYENIRQELERRLFGSVGQSKLLHHSGTRPSMARLDAIEAQIRESKAAYDEVWVTRIEKEQQDEERKKQFKDGIKENDLETWKLPSGIQLRLACSSLRCTLKIAGNFDSASLPIQEMMRELGKTYRAEYSAEYNRYDFYSDTPKELFAELKDEIDTRLQRPQTPIPTDTENADKSTRRGFLGAIDTDPHREIDRRMGEKRAKYPGLTEDQFEWFEERAAIRQFDGGMSREAAELAALVDVTSMH